MTPARLRPLGIVLGLVLLAGIVLQPVVEVVATTAAGETLACRRVTTGDAVSLVFTHSMYGGEVRETWRVAGGTLAREAIVAERTAAAEYYAYDGEVTRTADGFAVAAPALVVEALPVRVDQVGRHRLRFADGAEVSLADRVSGSAATTIAVRQRPLLLAGLAGCAR